jgi:hypothetical protein
LIARADAALEDLLGAETASFDEPAFQHVLSRLLKR